MSLLEIACFSAESALIAWKAGADRIELCDEQGKGGTTPSLQTVIKVKQHVRVPVFIMIRPRGGDFYYSKLEFERMLADIDNFKPYADGFVFGVLSASSDVDIQRTSALVRRAAPRPCTFHRAIDATKDIQKSLEDVVATGCRAVLSSGSCVDAGAGASTLADLVRQAQHRIIVMPGGGVRTANLAEILQVTGAAAFHSSGITSKRALVDVEEIAQMRHILRSTTDERTNTTATMKVTARA